jgi:MinD-like ATPase involved in chromosome partitioning or flagellar assembly
MSSNSQGGGKIITFYSYKGGTGRSMTLANVAWILASQGKRVLVLDWDFEAPGLHRYLYPFLADKDLITSEGLIDFVIKFTTAASTPDIPIKREEPKPEGQTAKEVIGSTGEVSDAVERVDETAQEVKQTDVKSEVKGQTSPASVNSNGAPKDEWYKPYANILRYASSLKWEFKPGGSLDFVPAGRQGPSYSTRVNSFNWQFFYDKLNGGALLEMAKEKMRAEYDYILIDSRTGVSDTSGICTVQMPDILVVCFTLNNQSIAGAAAVANAVNEQRLKLGKPIKIYPVPMRVETAEQKKRVARTAYAKEKFRSFPNTDIDREKYWHEIPVLYIAYYAYEEILAAFGEKDDTIISLLASAERLTSYLTENEVQQLAPATEDQRREILAVYEDRPVEVDEVKEIGRAAESLYLTLTLEEQVLTRRVFLRLVRVGRVSEVADYILRQASLAEFDPQASQVIQVFRNERLLKVEKDASTGRETWLQIANEKLLQGWTRLREWLDKDREFLLWLQGLQSAVEKWEQTKRDKSALFRGVILDEARKWLLERRADLTAIEKHFVEASLAQERVARGYSERSTRQTSSVSSRSGSPSVFVVMPFGVKETLSATPNTDSPTEKPTVNINFDDVYGLLVEPALIKAGYRPFRADRESVAGEIITDMYYELVTADFVVADISFPSVNVFYQLGVRHGVGPRGVLMLHGGWTKRPFDVAADRTFDYDGKLFGSQLEVDDDHWQERLETEVDRLAQVLRQSLEMDEQTIGSPVYKELVGLKPVDWSHVQSARAKYFGEVFADWRSRVEVAKLNGWPGDILTFADDAPIRSQRVKLLWQAADALCSMDRFNAALPVLRDLLILDPKHRDAQIRTGLVLSRLGKVSESKVHMLTLADAYKDDPEAQGILGRVYKELWQLEWKDLESLEDRQQQAVAVSNYLASSIRSYDQAARKRFDYYNGINVVAFVKLLEYLKEATGEQPVDIKVKDIDALISVVRFAMQNTLDSAGLNAGREGVWAAATLGELELVAGDAERARTLYRDAANAPDATYFNVNAMLDQIYLFESLGFHPEAVAGVKKILELRQKVLEQKLGGLKKSEPRFQKVMVASGHMIDTPDRRAERFPPHKEGVVRERIATQLVDWNVGPGDLAICGAARGADMLFAELCAERGAEVWLFIALPEGEFIEKSVNLPDSDWERRFYALRYHESVKTFQQLDRLGSPPKGTSVFARNNLWMINTARVEANDPKNLYALLVWDQKPTGDGAGGTSDFADRVKQLGGRLAPIINPTTL